MPLYFLHAAASWCMVTITSANMGNMCISDDPLSSH